MENSLLGIAWILTGVSVATTCVMRMHGEAYAEIAKVLGVWFATIVADDLLPILPTMEYIAHRRKRL